MVILYPGVHLLAVGMGADAEHTLIGAFKHRLDGFEFKGLHNAFAVPAQQINQQRSHQWAVHDQTRIAFDLRHITPVVMDAVGG